MRQVYIYFNGDLVQKMLTDKTKKQAIDYYIGSLEYYKHYNSFLDSYILKNKQHVTAKIIK
jgi:hypothetical protein